MRTNLLLSFLILACIAVQAQSPHDIVRIEFVSLTRGYHEKIVFTKDSVEMTKNKATTAFFRKIKKDEWNGLIRSLDSVTLSALPQLKSPTMKRAYDGALHSTITITTADGQSWRHGFDDENPNAKLTKLMDAIVEIKKTISE